MKVFAIVVTYNGMQRSWVQRCFDSILDSSIPIEIIAVDNGSTDGTIAYIQSFYPNADLIAAKENLGFGRANNLGIKKALKAGAEYVFLLNQDAWVDKETIERLILQSQLDPTYGVISPLHLNGTGETLDYNFSLNITPDKCPRLYADFVLNETKDTIYKGTFICAAAWLITKTCLKLVGGFNPTFFHYGEDDNYCHRLDFKGLKIGVYPHVKIYHDRQERILNIQNNDETVKRRKLLVKASNPNVSFDVNVYIKQINKHILEALFFNKRNKRKELQATKQFILSHRETIYQNLNLSKAKVDYPFLDI